MKKCPYCAKENHEDAIECIYCGGDLSSITIIDESQKQADTVAHQVDQRAIKGFEYIEKQPLPKDQKKGEKMSRANKVFIFWFGYFALTTIIKLFNGSLRLGADLYWGTFTALLNSIITLGVMSVVEFIWKKIKPSPGQEKNSDVINLELSEQVDTESKKKVETRIGVLFLRAYKVFRWVLAFFLLVTGINVISGDLAMSQALELLGIYIWDTFQWISIIVVPYWLYVYIRSEWKTKEVPMKIFLVVLAVTVSIVGLLMLFPLLI